jgi:hypothetical protein
MEDTKEFFIIPNKEYGNKFAKNKSLYILVKKSDYPNAKNKYHEFKNRFDLLERGATKNPRPETLKKLEKLLK